MKASSSFKDAFSKLLIALTCQSHQQINIFLA
jgi:hypothetical protein